MCEASCTWSGQLPPRNYKNPTYSCKVFLGGVPWDITECKYANLLSIFNFNRLKSSKKLMFCVVFVYIIFASQGLRFGSPFSPPLADLEYILKFARNATWWFIEVAPLR